MTGYDLGLSSAFLVTVKVLVVDVGVGVGTFLGVCDDGVVDAAGCCCCCCLSSIGAAFF
jgi:hypothetical protein